MSDQVDEEALSFLLESSLSLLEDEHNSISENNHQTSESEISDVKKNLLGSINALESPFKISNVNLRKEVLVQNMNIPNITKVDSEPDEKVEMAGKEQVDVEIPNITKVGSEFDEKVETASKEQVDDDIQIIENYEKVETASKEQEDDDILIIEEILAKDYIVIDEYLETSIPESIKKKPEKEELTEKVEKKRGLDVDYVSKDPMENADNNNPDWLLLQKLETDEERYKAVRERWRNLIVPEPNKDLTCFAWCRTQFAANQNENRKDQKEIDTEIEFLCKGRKRTFSTSEIQSPMRGRARENSEKRIRTLSCTRVYDEKIAALRRHLSEECLKIDKEQRKALDNLSDHYHQQRRYLSNQSLNTGVPRSAMLDELDQYHYQQRINIQRSYEDLSLKFLEKQSSQLRNLEEASAEVITFHRFYQGLDDCAPESMALTEEQSQEVDEINQMYEAFLNFYEE